MKFNVKVISVKPTHERTNAEKVQDVFPPDLVTVQAAKGDRQASRQKTYTLVIEDNKYTVGQKLRLEDRREKGKQGLSLHSRKPAGLVVIMDPSNPGQVVLRFAT